MMYPLVRELAADGIPVTVTCRVLGFSPQAYPSEFRRDVVAVVRRKEVPLTQIAKDFGISPTCLHRWLKRAEIEDGVRNGLTLAEEAEIRELKKRNRLLEQENEVLRRAAIYLGQGLNPK